METGQLKRAINELRLESLDAGNVVMFPVLSDSMAPLLSADDDIGVRKVRRDEIGSFDIIVWNPLTNRDALPRSYIAHRVVMRRRNGDYLTKGDLNVRCDKDPVPFDAVVGKVISVEKKRWGRTVRLDSFPGLFLNALCWGVAMLSSLSLTFLQASVSFLSRLVPELTRRDPAEAMIDRSSFDVPVAGWQRSVEDFRAWYRGGHFSSIGDVLIRHNHSEEAMGLSRRGTAVQGLDPASIQPAGFSFDLVIAARVLNCIPVRSMRRELLKNIYASLTPGGTFFLSVVNPQRDWVERWYADPLRALLSLLLGKFYAGPAAGDLMVRHQFIRHAYSLSGLRKELREAGWHDISLTIDGPVIHGVALKH